MCVGDLTWLLSRGGGLSGGPSMTPAEVASLSLPALTNLLRPADDDGRPKRLPGTPAPPPSRADRNARDAIRKALKKAGKL